MLNYGPDGPINYADPQHVVTGGMLEDQWNINNVRYDSKDFLQSTNRGEINQAKLHDDVNHLETDASANSADPDYSLFTSPVVDGATSFDGVFDGNGVSDVTANLDPSILNNFDNSFDLARQGDIGAFDSTSNLANTDGTSGSDWTSALASNGIGVDNDGISTGDLIAANVDATPVDDLSLFVGSDESDMFAK